VVVRAPSLATPRESDGVLDDDGVISAVCADACEEVEGEHPQDRARRHGDSVPQDDRTVTAAGARPTTRTDPRRVLRRVRPWLADMSAGVRRWAGRSAGR
jgi:hypothetical protein